MKRVGAALGGPAFARLLGVRGPGGTVFAVLVGYVVYPSPSGDTRLSS